MNARSESEIWDALTATLGPRVEAVEQRQDRRGIIRVGGDHVPETVRVLFEDFGARLATMTGLDVRDGVQILYHFCFEPGPLVISVKTIVRRPDLAIGSVTPIIPGAEFIEREIMTLLGVTFRGHPNPVRLNVADDWPQGLYPLRREFDPAAQNPGAFEGAEPDAPGRGR